MSASPVETGYAARVLEEGFIRLVTVGFVLLGVIFGLMQPAGSAGLGRAAAVGFWVLHALAALPCILGGTFLLSRLGLGRRLSPMGFVIASGLLAAVAFSLLALGIELAFGVSGADPDDARVAAEWGFAGLWLDELGGVAPPFLLAWILVNLPRLMRLGSPAAAGADRDPEAGAPGPAAPARGDSESDGFLSRLPTALGTDVILLSSDLHYLHVHTPRGRTMLLYNLADAERELGQTGLRVHRSHWIAERHVKRVRRRGSGFVCVLSGGLEAPVSRRRQKEVLARFGRDTAYSSGEGHGD